MKNFKIVVVSLLISIGLLFGSSVFADATVTFTGIGEVAFTKIFVGNYNTCAIGTNDKTYCGGHNAYGQLGNGSTSDRSTPVEVLLAGGIIIKDIQVGIRHTCAIGTNDKMYCWGYNDYGQLGDGTTTNRSTPVEAVLPGGITVKKMQVRSNYTCAIGTNDKMYCWGYNDYGQLGDGTTTNRSTPVEAVLPGGITVKGMQAGSNYACAIGTNDKVYCWGYNRAGQLGDGTTGNRSSPVEVVLPGGTVKGMKVGDFHACAIGTNDKIYCWGYNNNGQLGDGTTSDISSPVEAVLPGGIIAKDIQVGNYYSCAIGTDDKVYCWGYNLYGQLGDGTTTNRHTPVEVILPGGTIVKSMQVRSINTCIIRSDDKVYCWGPNRAGQLGDGTTSDRPTPIEVILSGGITIKDIQVGNNHSCAIGSNDKSYCWGYNNNGQLGDDTNTSRSVPTLVLLPMILRQHHYHADIVTGSTVSGELVHSGSMVTVILHSGYTFSGWSDGNTSNPRTEVSGGVSFSLRAKYIHTIYTMTFDSMSGTTIASMTGYYMNALTSPAIPTKAGYTFSGWNPVLPATIPLNNQTFVAIWNINPPARPTGGGASAVSTTQNNVIQDICPNGDYSPSKTDRSCGIRTQETITEVIKPEEFDAKPTNNPTKNLISFNTTNIYNPSIDDGYCFTRKSDAIITNSIKIYTTEEFQKSLMFLYSYDMTIFNSVDNFDPYRALTRQEAAKIFTNFATNVLCRTADKNLQPTYADINDVDPSLKKYITSAYQLGLMKGGDDTTFRPFDTITKAEFNAVLVRMILHSYLSENTSTSWYSEYNKVSEKLGIIKYGAGINPVNRNDASLMLFRAYKNQEFLLQDGNSNSYVLLDHAEFVK